MNHLRSQEQNSVDIVQTLMPEILYDKQNDFQKANKNYHTTHIQKAKKIT